MSLSRSFHVTAPMLALAMLLFAFSLTSDARASLILQHRGGAVEVVDPTHDHATHSHTFEKPVPVQRPGAQQPIAAIPCLAGFAGPYPCHNVDLLAFVPTNSLVGSTGADIWGWTDPLTGKEYAVTAHSNATSFVDVSDPVNPAFLGYVEAPVENVLWRDVKVYNNHAYIVGDGDFIDPHGLQIFDLTQLRGVTVPTIFPQTAHYDGVGNTHNIAINEDTGMAYLVGSNTCAGGLHMLDLADPVNPAHLGCFDSDGYTHDTQCVVYNGSDSGFTGREICFSANEDTLTIVDVTDKNNPVQLSRETYAGFGYSHQGWLTEDQAYFVLGDETDELDSLTAGNPHNTYSYIWDVRDLTAPVLINTYVGPTAAIDHNIYIRDNYVYEANYTAGLRILDADDIANGNLTEVAYFDTHPADDATAFAGSWSSYPFFESGIVILSNIEDGLYILQPNLDGSPEPPGPSDVDSKTTGGGYLRTDGRDKINFGFNAQVSAGALSGELQLNDKGADVKIHVSDIIYVGAVDEGCGAIAAGPSALEVRGRGTFNGAAASFRFCAEDNGEPGRGSDRFYLGCLNGCTYNTASRATDNVVDGGNLQVRRSAATNGPSADEKGGAGLAGGNAVATLILDPVLLTEGVAGAAQPFTVRAFDAGQEPLVNAQVSVTQVAANGASTTLTGLTDGSGLAVFTFVTLDQPAEYTAASGAVGSNAVAVTPLLP